MFDVKLNDNTSLLYALARPADVLACRFKENKGARIGQSTVVSQKMHTFTPDKPEEIRILQNVDAGQSFYQRRDPGNIYHLDIFHQCGQVDHSLVARAVKQAVDLYNFHYNIGKVIYYESSREGVTTDLIDVQTATGGGRITGSLNYGQKLSLRRAHENHVHIAAQMPVKHLTSLFYIVMAVESVIIEQQLELRRNERIVHTNGGSGSQTDMSPYSDYSDSFLKQRDAGAGNPPEGNRHQVLEDIEQLADDFDTVQDMREFLGELSQSDERELRQSLKRRGVDEQVLKRLGELGIADMNTKGLSLTSYGKHFKAYLESHQPEVDAHLRRAFRLLTPLTRQPGRSKVSRMAVGGGIGKPIAEAVSLNGMLQELAVSETVNAAVRRAVAEKRNNVSIAGTDLRQFVRHKKGKAEICLLIDASASMGGHRIKAAKFLARHLLLTTPDKISIITFQEEYARVGLSFTRDYGLAQESLRQITALGSTPLALGIRTCVDYLKVAGTHNPLIILITDGIPTVADQSADALSDALAAAEEIRKNGFGFTCLGLKPHRQYLSKLAEKAGGTVYVLDELEKHALVDRVWRERAGHQL